MRNALTALVFAATAGLTTPAAADDVVFNVPVRIENADLLSGGSVYCHVVYNTEVTGENFVSATAPVPITRGAYNGAVAVTVALPSGVSRDNAQSWTCRLDLTLSAPGAAPVQLNGSTSEAARRARYAEASGRVVTSSRLGAIAPFPH